MLFVQTEGNLGMCSKKELTEKEVDFLKSQVNKYLEIDNLNFTVDSNEVRTILRPIGRYYITDNDYIKWASLLPENQTVLVTVCNKTGDYKDWYIPSEWM